MVTKEQIERINELYKKQKGEGLTPEEKNEQTYLRQLYVDAMKENLRSQLKNIKVVDADEYEKIKKEEECECEECGCEHDHAHEHKHKHDCNCGCSNKEHNN